MPNHKHMMAGLILSILSGSAFAEPSVELIDTEKWKCINVETGETKFTDRYQGPTTEACIAEVELNPGVNYHVVGGPYLVRNELEEPKEWVVAKYWRADVRPMYEINADGTRGMRLDESSDPELIGRCEPPLDALIKKRYLPHTNISGTRGLTYCAYEVPLGGAIDRPPVPCPWDNTIEATDPVCTEPPPLPVDVEIILPASTDGTVALNKYAWAPGDLSGAIDDTINFRQLFARVEAWITVPSIDLSSTESNMVFDIPGHLALWTYRDAVHARWYNRAGERRIARASPGSLSEGKLTNVVISWDHDQGHSLWVDGELMVHDWSTPSAEVYPAPTGADGGVYGDFGYGALMFGVYNLEIKNIDACSVNPAGTVNDTFSLPPQCQPDPVDVCPWDDALVASDPLCTEPPSPPVLGSATVEWEAPTENEDGTPLTDLASYKIYYGLTAQQLDDEVVVNDPQATTFELTNIPIGDVFVAMVAVNSAGVESVFSNQIVVSGE